MEDNKAAQEQQAPAADSEDKDDSEGVAQGDKKNAGEGASAQ